MSTRRQFLAGAGVLAVSSPFALAQFLTEKEPPVLLPEVHVGTALTASSWNALVRRVNELSKLP
jgi:hypothetical protein